MYLGKTVKCSKAKKAIGEHLVITDNKLAEVLIDAIELQIWYSDFDDEGDDYTEFRLMRSAELYDVVGRQYADYDKENVA